MVPAVIADMETRFIFAPIETGGHQTGSDVKSKLTELPMKCFGGRAGSEGIACKLRGIDRELAIQAVKIDVQAASSVQVRHCERKKLIISALRFEFAAAERVSQIQVQTAPKHGKARVDVAHKRFFRNIRAIAK